MTINKTKTFASMFCLTLLCSSGLSAATNAAEESVEESKKLNGLTIIKKDNPEVTYSPEDSTEQYPIAPSGEVYLPPTAERMELHGQNHQYYPIVTATIPPFFEAPAMDNKNDYISTKENMVVLNPAPEEFLWVMEGKRKGFNDLTIVLTNTVTGNGAPMHTHVGEEAHVLLQGRMRYFLKDEVFTVKAPYIVNIPSMVPHAFMNVHPRPAKLVGIFPESNHWEYDVLAADPFGEPGGETTQAAAFKNAESFNAERHLSELKDWYSPQARAKRLAAYRNQVTEKVWSQDGLRDSASDYTMDSEGQHGHGHQQ